MFILCVLKFGQTANIELECDDIRDFTNFGKTCSLNGYIISNNNKDSYSFPSDPQNAEVKTIMIGGSTLAHIPGDFKKAFPKFDTLDFGENSITNTDGTFFKEAENLKTLHFNGLNLKGLNSEFFDPLKDLERLTLMNCNLENLTSSNLFRNNKKLQGITLKNNDIDSISPKIFEDLNLLNVEIVEKCVNASFTQASIKNLKSTINNCTENFYIGEITNLRLQLSEFQSSTSKKIEDVQQSLQEDIKKTDEKVQKNTDLMETIGKILNKNSTNSVEKDVEVFVQGVDHLKTMSERLDEESQSLLGIASNQQIILYCLIAITVVVLIEFLMLLFRK